MKKLVCFMLVFSMCFAFCSCSTDKEDEQTTEKEQYLENAPILGVQIETEDNVGFYALTKSGEYQWAVTDENGEEVFVHEGEFCLDFAENLCTFTREQTGGNIKLDFTGSVLNYKIYQAPREEIESDRKKILDEKYLIDNNSGKITFPESGEYYYVVKVNYAQGEVPYGFLLAE